MVPFLFRVVFYSLLSTLLHAGVSLLGVGSLSSGQKDSSLAALPVGSFLPPNATFAFLNHSQVSLLTNDPADNMDNAALFTRVEGVGMVLSMDQVLMQSAGGLWMHEKEQPTTFTRGSASLRFHFLKAPTGPDDSNKAVLSISHRDTSAVKPPLHEGVHASDDSVVDITAHSLDHATGIDAGGSPESSSSSRYYVVTVKGSVVANDYLLTTAATPATLPLSSVVRDLIVLNQSIAASTLAAEAVGDGDGDDADLNHVDYHDIATTASSQSDESPHEEATLSLHSALTVLTRAVNHR